MAEKKDKIIFQQKRWWSGMSNFIKEDIPNSFFYAQSIDFRTDSQALTLLPASIKESGSQITDLLKWGDTTPENLDVYTYGSQGNIYKRTIAGSWSKLHTAASSHGNGLQYFYGDDYLYYANDATLGRYGPIASSTPQFADDFLKAQGGTPTNTASLLLASASSQYATAVSSASLQVTGNLTLETEFKANSLPSVNNSMTLVGKWDESVGRSYKLDLYGVSGFFGDGSDGALTISVDTTDSPIDAACSGTSGTNTLSATNVSFVQGQKILIIQMWGTNAGSYMRTTIQGYTAGTITTADPLNVNYSSSGGNKAQVIVIKQHTNITVNGGVLWVPKAWNGTTGGILIKMANGTITNNGTIYGLGAQGGQVGDSVGATTVNNGGGFRGGRGDSSPDAGAQSGEGTTGASTSTTNTGGSGGAGGASSSGGAGGGYGTAGANGGATTGGTIVGSQDLTTSFILGGGGGGGGAGHGAGGGGNSGAGVFLIGATITGSGTINTNGADGRQPPSSGRAGGGGSGGPQLYQCQTMSGTLTFSSAGGAGGSGNEGNGGAGGSGRVHVDYLTAETYSSSNPTPYVTQDNSLVTTTTIQARLGISNDGTAFEYLTQNLNSLTTGTWNRLSVAWTASTSVALFYLNGSLLGSFTGTKTAINSNASALSVGANKVSAYQNFFDGLLNDMRIWANVQSASQIFANNSAQLTGNEGGLKAYYTFNSVYTDKTANANTLTAVNAPTFSTSDVPYPAPTTRLDIDQSATTGTVNTYTLKAAISEAQSDQLSFTPLLDPQKSMAFSVNGKGTGSWVLTIHDAQNNVIATQTITNANLPSGGYVEFIFTAPWRIVINKTYHAHLTQSTADGTVICVTATNFSTANYYTYYGFLVTDTNFHPIARMLNKIIIGNERYLGTWDGASYNANFIAFPPQTHVRCFGFWRDYLAIGTWQENISGVGNIYDWSVGRVYFWDGISLTFNFWIDVPEGQVNALYGIDTNLYIWAGWNGQLLMYQGGYIYASGNSISNKVKKMPLMERESYVEIYPQGMTMWRSMLHIGVAANSNSTTLPRGVYSYGTTTAPYPEALSGNDYPISTGNTGSTVKIGMVYAAGQTLLIGWQDGASYGCDQVNFVNNPVAGYGTIQALVQDNEEIWHQESPMKMRVDHLPLRTGESVVAKYKIDRETSWESSNSITDSQTTKFTTNQISDGRGREYQLAADMYATNGTSPTLLGLSGLIDMNATEQAF